MRKKMSAGAPATMVLIALAGGCGTNGDVGALPADRGATGETVDPPAADVGDDRAVCTGSAM